MPKESGYKAISTEDAIRFAIQRLENKGVESIKVCETSWIVAPLGGFLIDGFGKLKIGEKEYSTFRIGITDGSEGDAGDEFGFIARGADDKEEAGEGERDRGLLKAGNLQAFRLLRKEGLLFTFSCSHHIDADLFQKIVFSAALDSGKRVQLLGRMGHPWDHPINLCHPEGEYLKGLICRVL
jgi:hypothetical protein